MALPEGLAEVITKSNAALAETLANAFQNMKLTRAPKAKLSKFCGPPKKPGDVTFNEWLEELDLYARQLGLGEDETVGAAIDHLGGDARDEVLCSPPRERDTLPKLVGLLRRMMGPPVSLATLTSTLYARTQNEGESLAEYSRCLMRIHDQMEQSCGPRESEALRLLRDGVLKEQFVKGVAELPVRRKLRRIQVERPELDFFQIQGTCSLAISRG